MYRLPTTKESVKAKYPIGGSVYFQKGNIIGKVVSITRDFATAKALHPNVPIAPKAIIPEKKMYTYIVEIEDGMYLIPENQVIATVPSHPWSFLRKLKIEDLENLKKQAALLKNPYQRAILAVIEAKEDPNVSTIQSILREEQSQVSQRLAKLREAGFVDVDVRGTSYHYSLNRERISLFTRLTLTFSEIGK